ncbi:sugar phosphate isomerase/epimerase family protein [Paramagnetospirillum kuznetsovii]|nr:TIM barrel protein [Paramagnetospirillum kuznetsovii]
MPLADAIAACRGLGRRRIEVSAPHPWQPIEEMEAVLATTAADGVLLSLHNYFPAPPDPIVLNVASPDPAELAQSRALIAHAARLARAARAPVYGVHAGYLGKATPSDGDDFQFADPGDSLAAAQRRAIATLAAVLPLFAPQTRLLVENLFPSKSRRHSLMCDIEELAEYLDQLPQLGWLLDLGHLNVSANLLGFDRQAYLDHALARFGGRLREVHISENDGQTDQHLPIGQDSWQLGALARIKMVPTDDDEPRIYCVECRRADRDELIGSLDRVDAALAA